MFLKAMACLCSALSQFSIIPSPFQPDPTAVHSDSKEKLGPGSVSIPEELYIMYDCI